MRLYLRVYNIEVKDDDVKSRVVDVSCLFEEEEKFSLYKRLMIVLFFIDGQFMVKVVIMVVFLFMVFIGVWKVRYGILFLS